MPKSQITFVTISHINYWDQVNSWKNLWKFWKGPLCRDKSGPFPLLNVAGYWKSSNTEVCAKKLSQMLANNIDHRGRGLVSEFKWGIVVWVKIFFLLKLDNTLRVFSLLCFSQPHNEKNTDDHGNKEQGWFHLLNQPYVS